MSTALDIDIDSDLMKELESLDDSVKCSFVDCDKDATHILRCPCFEGNETMCSPHTASVREGQSVKTAVIVFNETCGHTVRLSDCAILSI